MENIMGLSDLRNVKPRTWSEIKTAVENAGIKNNDVVFSIDLGPYVGKIIVDRDEQGVEITDDANELLG